MKQMEEDFVAVVIKVGEVVGADIIGWESPFHLFTASVVHSSATTT